MLEPPFATLKQNKRYWTTTSYLEEAVTLGCLTGAHIRMENLGQCPIQEVYHDSGPGQKSLGVRPAGARLQI